MITVQNGCFVLALSRAYHVIFPFWLPLKKHPPVTIDNDIRPISLTPIIAKVFESLELKWVDVYVKPHIDDKQYGGMAGTCTTDALVEMLHKWYESTDITGNFESAFY